MSGLSRRKASAPRPEGGPNEGSNLVASGTIRSADETDALSIEITIDQANVAMRYDEVELGKWPTSAVEIRRIDQTAFEFIAEGDRLIFVPEDPATFGASTIVGQTPKEGNTRKKRRAKRKPRTTKTGRRSRRVSSEEDRREHPALTAEAAQEDEPTLRSPDDLEEAVPAESADVASGSSITLDTHADFSDDVEAADEPASPETHRRIRLQRSGKEERSDPDEATPEDPDDGLNRTWLRALDVARKYDIFGLDRVPIDETERGQEHEHTWDHRVATSSGAGSRICTICGKIRR